MHSVFDERCIYRIDHYLGREAVQNLLALRFANGMFEPVWNRNHIDHVQIDVPETLSIEMRGRFYEETGAFRDMIVTHLFQVLGFVAMEPPTSLKPKALGVEREKVFDSMPPLRPRETSSAASTSAIATRTASPPTRIPRPSSRFKAYVDNWRWEGVPFYLRSGKRLAESRHLLTIAYAQPPRRMFPLDCDHDRRGLRIRPPDLRARRPAAASRPPSWPRSPARRSSSARRTCSFSYADTFGGPEQALDPYERLIHDVMVGDRTFFTSSEAIERLWEISEPALDEPPPLKAYAPGSTGPSEMDDLIAPRRWHIPRDHI